MKSINTIKACPCASGKDYKHCCRQYIEKETDAQNVEALMRSRYTAFVQMNATYLRYSWHPETCPDNLNLDANTKWLGLEIKTQLLKQSIHNNNGETVEFVARYKINGKAFKLHEISQFTQYHGRWVYLRGLLPLSLASA